MKRKVTNKFVNTNMQYRVETSKTGKISIRKQPVVLTFDNPRVKETFADTLNKYSEAWAVLADK
mgnify:CR=1 FL=1